MLSSCATIRLKPFTSSSPIVRIGVSQGQERILFEPRGQIYLASKSLPQTQKFSEKGIWTASVSAVTSARKDIRIQLFESSALGSAQKYVQEAGQRGIQAELSVIGDALSIEAQPIIDHRLYRVYLTKKFDSEIEANLYLQASSGLDSARIVTEKSKQVQGQVKMVGPSGKELLLENPIRISAASITVKGVDVGSGFHWAKQEDRTYRGEMEFRIDDSGKLAAINVLPLEEYLYGVVAAEMSPNFPIEALKAQAITARTFFLYNFGRNHRGDGFDACGDVHCQAYGGMGKESDKIFEAVNRTRGMVLAFNEALCLTPYNAVCGGHGENAENVWDGDGRPYLQGAFDLDAPIINSASFDLSQEENIKSWINSLPNVYCNVGQMGTPDFASSSASYFRWEYRAARSELEQLLQERTGRAIGTLLDIVPGKRGVSGRLKEVRIVGTRDTVTVRKELNIRRALAKNTLNSACFVVAKNGGTGNVPDEFIFRGAGWGHGVGMCQTGAAIMASRGKSFPDILAHYYQGTKMKQMY